MSAFHPIPLGRPIPGRPHAVSCSLPTMQDLIGYEEKRPETMEALSSGYPRFVVHHLVRKAAGRLAAEAGLAGCQLWLTSSPRMAEALHKHLGGPAGARPLHHPVLSGIAIPAASPLNAEAKLYLQHTGGFLSSRQAEDFLWLDGALPARAREEWAGGDPAAQVRGVVARAHGVDDPGCVLLANSGMNAIWAAFGALDALQRARGRNLWIQLGWLYLDTIAILGEFTEDPSCRLVVHDAADTGAMRALFAAHGARIAGIVAEAPTNPLVQTPDLPAIAELAWKHGACVIADPSIASAFNVRLLPWADVATNSLTKYTAPDGDVIAGAVVVNPARPGAAGLLRAVSARLEPVYHRDLARLAAQIGGGEALVRTCNGTLPRVVDFLQGHPAVDRVWWALQPASAGNYRRIARDGAGAGSMVSFTLRKPLASFYDRVRLPKGPSFGMSTSLLCPFIHLAHYNLVTTGAGRRTLAEAGIPPDLLRLSVGAEPAGEIIGALEEALA